MNEVAALTMRVQSLEVEQADNRLKSLKNSSKGAEGATNGLTSSFKSLIAPLLATVSAVGALNKLVSTTREFDVLNASLITATGSAEGAGVAFEALQEFAAKTPYDLAQAVDGFTKLVNLGLTPSEKALISYGNTASAMGKDLNQMIEAVADASTMEFERLKEFGIKTKQEGDNVSFTFRGVTTTVKKNADEIEGYLMALGENEFAGAMETRMDSLDGALSNLDDTWNQLFLNISKSGVGDLIEEQVRNATAALDELNAMILSGELLGYLDAFGMKFQGYTRDFQNLYTVIEGLIKESDSLGVDLLGAFTNLPENVRFFIQAMVIEVMTGFDKVVVYSKDIVDKIKAIFTDDTIEAANQRMTDSINGINAVREESLQAIADERQAAISSSEAQVEASKKLRVEYEKLQQEKEKQSGTDPLSGFYKGTKAVESTAEDPKLKKKRETEFAKVQEALRSEEETILESYNKRRDIILKNTEETSEARANLLKSLNEKFATDVMGDWKKPDTHEEEMAEIEKFYQDRRQLILDNTALTEEERTELELELTRNRNEKLDAMEAKRRMVVLGAASDLFDGLAGIAEQFSGRQSGVYKALFAISKAFSIAQATVSIATGIAKAQELGFPANLGAMASVVSSTAGVLSTIKGAKIEGQAHDGMTNIPREGTWNLQGGERVIAPKQNRDLTKFLEQKTDRQERGTVNIQIFNNASDLVEVETEEDEEGRLKFFINAAKNSIRQDIQEGRGIGRDIQQRYGLGSKAAI